MCDRLVGGDWKWVTGPCSPWAHLRPHPDSLPLYANAWELGEGYNVAESVPGQGVVLTGVAGQEPHHYGRTQ